MRSLVATLPPPAAFPITVHAGTESTEFIHFRAGPRLQWETFEHSRHYSSYTMINIHSPILPVLTSEGNRRMILISISCTMCCDTVHSFPSRGVVTEFIFVDEIQSSCSPLQFLRGSPKWMIIIFVLCFAPLSSLPRRVVTEFIL